MNILLDTNSFRYLYQIENGMSAPEKIDGKRFNAKDFVDFCSSCSNLYIPSETLFELMFQDVKKNNNINEFCEQYQFINEFKRNHKLQFQIMNSISDLNFDNNYFVECVNKRMPIDLGKYINVRVTYEMELMLLFLRSIHTIAKDVIVEVTGDKVFIDDFENFIDQMYTIMENDIEKLYKSYYIEYSMGIKEFEIEIDGLLGIMLYGTFEKINSYTHIINPKLSIDSEIQSKFISKYKEGIKVEGANYVKDVFRKLKSRCDVQNQFSKEFKDYINIILAKKNYAKEQTNYIELIAEQFITGRKVRKNDVLDYSLVTSLNENATLINPLSTVKKNEIFLITFDKTLHNFCKNNNWLYDEAIYNTFLK